MQDNEHGQNIGALEQKVFRFILTNGFKWVFCLYSADKRCYELRPALSFTSPLDNVSPKYELSEGDKAIIRKILVFLDEWVSVFHSQYV